MLPRTLKGKVLHITDALGGLRGYSKKPSPQTGGVQLVSLSQPTDKKPQGFPGINKSNQTVKAECPNSLLHA